MQRYEPSVRELLKLSIAQPHDCRGCCEVFFLICNTVNGCQLILLLSLACSQCYSPWMESASRLLWSVVFVSIFASSLFFTGSIAWSATRRYLIYSEADFEVFRPAGRHVALMGVKFGMEEGTGTGAPKKSKFAQNCGFLVTGSRHNEHIQMKFGL